MVEKKGVAYTLGILSIVLAFFIPLAGVILGIIGLVQNKKEKSKISKKLNIIGIIIGVIIFIATLALSFYLTMENFPIY